MIHVIQKLLETGLRKLSTHNKNMVLVDDYDIAHKVVNRSNNLFWDGWTIVEFKPNQDAVTYKNAMFRKGKWGITKKFEPTRDGWMVPKRYV